MEICKYCETREAIQNSHSIPSFVYKWLKDTSTTGFIRATNNPNQRLQDGPKSPLLCKECESNFSKVENNFKKEFFSKLANYRQSLPEILPVSVSTKTCISIIAWRVLADTYFFPKENEYTKEEFETFPKLLNEIKDSIESKIQNHRIHLIPCDKDILIKLNLPKVDFSYYERSIGVEPRIWDNWERFIIFIKIPFAIIVFEVVPGKNDSWTGTRIDDSDSIAISGIKSVPSYVAARIDEAFKIFLEYGEAISPAQKQKILDDSMKSDPNCGAIKTMNKTWS